MVEFVVCIDVCSHNTLMQHMWKWMEQVSMNEVNMMNLNNDEKMENRIKE